MAVKCYLECAILKHNVSSGNADIEASLATELSDFLYELLPAVELSRQARPDVELKPAWVVVNHWWLYLLLLLIGCSCLRSAKVLLRRLLQTISKACSSQKSSCSFPTRSWLTAALIAKVVLLDLSLNHDRHVRDTDAVLLRRHFCWHLLIRVNVHLAH